MEIRERLEKERVDFERLIESAEAEGERHANKLRYIDLFLVIPKMNAAQPAFGAAEKWDDEIEKLYRFCESRRLEKLTEAGRMNLVKSDLLKDLGELEKISSYYKNDFPVRSQYLRKWLEGFKEVISPAKKWLKDNHLIGENM